MSQGRPSSDTSQASKTTITEENESLNSWMNVEISGPSDANGEELEKIIHEYEKPVLHQTKAVVSDSDPVSEPPPADQKASPTSAPLIALAATDSCANVLIIGEPQSSKVVALAAADSSANVSTKRQEPNSASPSARQEGRASDKLNSTTAILSGIKPTDAKAAPSQLPTGLPESSHVVNILPPSHSSDTSNQRQLGTTADGAIQRRATMKTLEVDSKIGSDEPLSSPESPKSKSLPNRSRWASCFESCFTVFHNKFEKAPATSTQDQDSFHPSHPHNFYVS